MLESHYPPPPYTFKHKLTHANTLSPLSSSHSFSNDKHTHVQTEGIFFSFALCFLQRVICVEGAVKVG